MKTKSLRSRQIDLDPLSTTIVEDLMDSASEWRGVSDIIKLTLKALTDVVRVQGASIKEINNTLPTRASKSELSTGLALKANLQDVSRTFNEVSNALDNRITMNELHDVVKDYITKDEFQDALVVKGYANDPRNNSRIVTSSTYGEKNEDIQKQVGKRMAAYVTLNEFQELLTIVEQKPNISEVNQILENKVSKPVFNAALQKLVPRSEFELSLSKKADLADLEYIVSTLQTKPDLSTIEKLTEIIENKTDKSDIEALLAKFQQVPQHSDIELILESIEELKINIQKVGEEREVPAKRIEYIETQIGNLSNSLHSKISHSESSAITTNLKYEVNEEIAKMKMHIRNHLNEEGKAVELFSAKELLKEVSLWKKDKEGITRQMDKIKERLEGENSKGQLKELRQVQRQFSQHRKSMSEFKNSIILGLEQKLSTDELEQVLARWVEQIHIKMGDDKEDTLLAVRQIEQSTSIKIGDCSTQIQHLNLMAAKRQSSEESALEESLRRMRRQIEDVRKTVDKVYSELQNKLSQSEYESDLVDIRKKMDAAHKELLLKSNIKDVCVLVDSKPNIDEVNRALKQIHSQLSEKASAEELKAVVEDQATINQTLCEQNIIGRWLWHSGQSKAGNLIPWESQTVNTLPDNFLWDKDQTSILILASGLYEITANIFSKFKPSINLLINGEVAATQHSAEEKDKENLNGKKKKGKEMGSVKVHEFFMLPTRARVSVSFSGEPGSEGFLSIKRL